MPLSWYSRHSFQHAWTSATHYCTGSAKTCTDAYKPFKTPLHASLPTRECASTSRPSFSSYIRLQSVNVCSSRSPCWCTRHCTTSCLRIWRKIANLCLSLDADNCVPAFVGHRHVLSAANQHTSWRSLIRCCWTSHMEQSVNPAARVRHSKRIYLVTDNCSAK